MKSKYAEGVKSGHGVILIAHGQGNLFALEATNRDIISSGPFVFHSWMRDYVYHISIASPAPRFASDNHWLISLDNDPAANIPSSVGTNYRNPVRYFTHVTESISPAMEPTMANMWLFSPPIDASSPDGYWMDGTTPPSYTKTITTDGGFGDNIPPQEYTMHVIPDEWEYQQTSFHRFDYYFGLTSLPAHINGTKTIHIKSEETSKAIIDSIEEAIKKHEDASSQWNFTEELTCKTEQSCEESLKKVSHYKEVTSELYLEDKVYPFNKKGKLYQVNGSYVMASHGGVDIKDKSYLLPYTDICYELIDKDNQVLETIATCSVCPDPSLYEIISHNDVGTKDWRISVKNTETNETIEGVYPFNVDGSVYQLDTGEWVMASCGGYKIESSWEGQEEDECYRLKGTGEIIYSLGVYVLAYHKTWVQIECYVSYKWGGGGSHITFNYLEPIAQIDSRYTISGVDFGINYSLIGNSSHYSQHKDLPYTSTESGDVQIIEIDTSLVHSDFNDIRHLAENADMIIYNNGDSVTIKPSSKLVGSYEPSWEGAITKYMYLAEKDRVCIKLTGTQTAKQNFLSFSADRLYDIVTKI